MLSWTKCQPAVGLKDFMRITNGFKYWFRLDLRHAYHQLPLSKYAQHLTIISTFNGCYRWLSMPQGLICAGDLFDSCMEAVLANCTQTISSRDDVLGGGPTRESMLREYTKVLAALKVAGLPPQNSRGTEWNRVFRYEIHEIRHAAGSQENRSSEKIQASNKPRGVEFLDMLLILKWYICASIQWISETITWFGRYKRSF